MKFNNFCGIDVGCTNIKMMAVVDNTPVYKTIPSGDNFTREELLEVINDFYLSFNNDFYGLGIAISGCVANNTVERTTLPCLQGLSTVDFPYLNSNSVHLINDANAATLAGTVEFGYSKVLVGFTNGTGIGCGIAINGNLFTGSSGLLGEIYGNLIIDKNGNVLKIGKICSGSKILKKLEQSQSEEEKRKIIHESSIYLGILITNIMHFYNPDVIYFSGGGFDYNGFLDKAILFAKEHAYSDFSKNIIFARSTYTTYAGCIGAMKLASLERRNA